MSICVSSLPQAASNERLTNFPSRSTLYTGSSRSVTAAPTTRGEYMNAKIAATASTSAVPEANLLCRERKPPILPAIINLSPLADIL